MMQTLSKKSAVSAYGKADLNSIIDGADRYKLISILYSELERALEAMPVARQHKRYAIYAERQARALAILNGLENALDHSVGGQLSGDLAAVYRGVKRAIVDASQSQSEQPLVTARAMIGEVADAWRQICTRGAHA